MKTWSYTSVPQTPGLNALALSPDATTLFAAGPDVLQAYDLTDPAQPRLIAQQTGFGSSRQMACRDNLLFLTARNEGLWILNVENPRQPRILAHYDTVELATGLDVELPYVYVTLRIFGVEIIDCSKPDSPRHLALIRTPEAQSLTHLNQTIYVGNWQDASLSVIDTTNPADPKLRQTLPLQGYGDGVSIQGHCCYVATGLNPRGVSASILDGSGHGLEIFRIESEFQLTPVARLKFPRLDMKLDDFWTVKTTPNYAFVADTHNGVFKVDIRNPMKPALVGRLCLPDKQTVDGRGEQGTVKLTLPDAVTDLVPGNRMLYLAGKTTGLHLAPIDEPLQPRQNPAHNPRPCRKPIPTQPQDFQLLDLKAQVRRLDIHQDTLAAACSHGGVQLLDLTGKTPQLKHHIPLPCAYDVALKDSLLFVALGSDGLAVYDLQPQPRLMATWKKPGTAIQLLHLSDDGTILVASGRQSTLLFFQVGNPQAPTLAYTHTHAGLLYGDVFPDHEQNGKMPVIWPYAGLAWYDLQNNTPKLLRDDRTSCQFGQSDGLLKLGHDYLINNSRGECFKFNRQNPGIYTPLPELRATGVPATDGRRVAFANRRRGTVALFQIQGDSVLLPRPEQNLNLLPGTPDRPHFHRGRLFIPCGHLGIACENRED